MVAISLVVRYRSCSTWNVVFQIQLHRPTRPREHLWKTNILSWIWRTKSCLCGKRRPRRMYPLAWYGLPLHSSRNREAKPCCGAGATTSKLQLSSSCVINFKTLIYHLSMSLCNRHHYDVEKRKTCGVSRKQPPVTIFQGDQV